MKRWLLLSLPLLVFSQGVIKNYGASNNSTPSYIGALNYQTGETVLEKPEKARKTGLNIFVIDKYLVTIAKVRNLYKPTPNSAEKWEVPQAKTSLYIQINTEKQGAFGKGKPEKIRAVGYCEFDRDIKVFGRQRMYVNIPCYLNGLGGSATLFGELVPQLENYSLVLKPIELYTESGEIYKVISGYALSGDRSSPNVATEINLRRIEKILAKAGKSVAKDMREVIKDTAKGQQEEVNVNGDVVIKKNELSLNLLGKSALIDGIVALAEGIADVVDKETSNIPVTFKIAKGSLVYLNVIAVPERYQPVQVKQKENSQVKPVSVIKTMR
jgi:hypothetical protein